MALTSRIGRLERTARARTGPGAPCPECGAPAGTWPGVRMETPDGLPIGRRCPCGFWVGSDGRALCPVPVGMGFKVYGFDIEAGL